MENCFLKFNSMSKIGKAPVSLPEGVTVTQDNGLITVTGTKGTLAFKIPAGLVVTVDASQVVVKPEEGMLESVKPVFGLTRSQIANMVKGVSGGFEKKLELTGVGYRASVSGSDLQISVGFSHPIKIKSPEGVTFKVQENTISILGADKSIIGNIAATIRAIRPPEPYKGKGIAYSGEKIRRKAGKAAKAVGGK